MPIVRLYTLKVLQYQRFMGKETCVYPGSFRPFHKDHLNVVKSILNDYPEDNLVVVISGEANCRNGFLDCEEAFEIARLTLIDSHLADRINLRMVQVEGDQPIDWASELLKTENVSKVFTGSIKTIGVLEKLKDKSLWKGQIIKLNNSGVHGTLIRKLILDKNPEWKEYVSVSAGEYISEIFQNGR
jgi:nicotinamide mononucleotide adenylyltransferase